MLAYRREFGDWSEVFVDRHINTYTLEGLHCGASYQITLAAFNAIGSGTASKTETARTKGNKPIAPEMFHFIRSNITAVSLELSSWLDAGCTIQYFTVEFRRHDGYRHNDWIVVSSNVVAHSRFIIPDLEPSTAYNLRITANNNAGSTIAEYTFETLNIHGAPNNNDFLLPSGSVTDVFTENTGTMSIQDHLDLDIRSHFIIVIIGSVVGVLLAVIIAYICLKSSKNFYCNICHYFLLS